MEKDYSILIKFISHLLGLVINSVLFMYAGHVFHHNFNWGQAFWLSFFYTGILTNISALKE